jgi:hypothetical protein
MHDQLTRLASYAGEEPGIMLRVLPFSAGAHAASGSPSHTIMRFPHAPRLGVVSVQALSTGVYLDQPEDVTRYLTMFAMLTTSVLSPAGSAQLIGQIAEGAALGTPFFSISEAGRLWIGAESTMAKDESSFGGTGAQALHIDAPNVEAVPEYTSLLVLRPDPAGGGASLHGDLRAAFAATGEADRAALRQPVFFEGRAEGLHGVGAPRMPLPVLEDDEQGQLRWVQWAGKMTAQRPPPACPGPVRSRADRYSGRGRPGPRAAAHPGPAPNRAWPHRPRGPGRLGGRLPALARPGQDHLRCRRAPQPGRRRGREGRRCVRTRMPQWPGPVSWAWRSLRNCCTGACGSL